MERLTRQRINRLPWSITRFVRESLCARWSEMSSTVRRGHKQDDFLSLRTNREDAKKTRQIIQSLKVARREKKANIHTCSARPSCSLTRVSFIAGLTCVCAFRAPLCECGSVPLCLCTRRVDGVSVFFFLRKIGLLRETSCDEGRTEGEKSGLRRKWWRSSHGNQETLGRGKKAVGKGKLVYGNTLIWWIHIVCTSASFMFPFACGSESDRFCYNQGKFLAHSRDFPPQMYTNYYQILCF